MNKPPPAADSSKLAALRESAMQTSVSVLRLLRKPEKELRHAKAALQGQSLALAATASMLSATLEAIGRWHLRGRPARAGGRPQPERCPDVAGSCGPAGAR